MLPDRPAPGPRTTTDALFPMTDAHPTPRPADTRSVLLEHTLPDASVHFDWLIKRPHASDPPPEHRMVTFRCADDPLESPGAWTGTRIPDHRAHYLEYEGPVSGDRGAVRRIWRCPCRLLLETPERVEVELHIPNRPPRRFSLRATPTTEDSDAWSVSPEPGPDAEHDFH
jgi:hypothetical protein